MFIRDFVIAFAAWFKLHQHGLYRSRFEELAELRVFLRRADVLHLRVTNSASSRTAAHSPRTALYRRDRPGRPATGAIDQQSFRDRPKVYWPIILSTMKITIAPKMP